MDLDECYPMESPEHREERRLIWLRSHVVCGLLDELIRMHKEDPQHRSRVTSSDNRWCAIRCMCLIDDSEWDPQAVADVIFSSYIEPYLA
ncbi:hypothetical protein EIP91_009713 [Steccherinum ochraceum]|uniref:Uncharacterized protein n=1 Tax=Steccherinum ochraceum TaxID=92696 RepID=A0A4R0R9F4_9APHY|nr:hypothetical protein EIP91_009713 [Steccherinum ochraceum]